jgi:prepilin-type N-terminal cleavage/methylation domain-containing protein
MTSHRSMKESKGFTLVELLLGLAISAMLLTAVAAAFNASVMNYRENRQIYQTLNSARQALLRMTTQLRTADSVSPAADPNECSLVTIDGGDITYDYRGPVQTLYLIDNDAGAEYVLCEHVTAMTFTKTLTDDGLDCKSVRISMTLQIGDQIQTLSSAVAIRRNLQL